MTTSLGSWADGSGGGTPITAADLNNRDKIVMSVGGSASVLTPASPNAKDDEFDGTSSATWSNTPTAPTAWTVNSTYPGALLLQTSGLGAAVVGKVQSVPGAYPYTITTRLRWTSVRDNYQQAGIVIGPASPTGTSNCHRWGVKSNNAYRAYGTITTFAGTFVSEVAANIGLNVTPLWFRITVASASSVTSQWSVDGGIWYTSWNAVNPGYTPGVMGLFVNDESVNSGVDAVFDFFRVT